EPGHVVGQRGLGELRRGDTVAVSLQLLDDVIPARAVRPGAVDQDNVRQRSHCVVLPLVSGPLDPRCQPETAGSPPTLRPAGGSNVLQYAAVVAAGDLGVPIVQGCAALAIPGRGRCEAAEARRRRSGL